MARSQGFSMNFHRISPSGCLCQVQYNVRKFPVFKFKSGGFYCYLNTNLTLRLNSLWWQDKFPWTIASRTFGPQIIVSWILLSDYSQLGQLAPGQPILFHQLISLNLYVRFTKRLLWVFFIWKDYNKTLRKKFCKY